MVAANAALFHRCYPDRISGETLVFRVHRTDRWCRLSGADDKPTEHQTGFSATRLSPKRAPAWDSHKAERKEKKDALKPFLPSQKQVGGGRESASQAGPLKYSGTATSASSEL